LVVEADAIARQSPVHSKPWIEDDLGVVGGESRAAVALAVAVLVALVRVVRTDTVVGRVVDAVPVRVHERAVRRAHTGRGAGNSETCRRDQQDQYRGEQNAPLELRHSL